MSDLRPEFIQLHERGQELLQQGRALPEGTPERQALMAEAYSAARAAATSCPPDADFWPAFLFRAALYVGEWADAPPQELAELARRGLEQDPPPLIRDDLYAALAHDDPAWLLARLRALEADFDAETGCFLTTEPKDPQQAIGDLSHLLAMIDPLVEHASGLGEAELAELREDAVAYRVLRAYQTQCYRYLLQTTEGLDAHSNEGYISLIGDDLEEARQLLEAQNSMGQDRASELCHLRMLEALAAWQVEDYENVNSHLESLRGMLLALPEPSRCEMQAYGASLEAAVMWQQGDETGAIAQLIAAARFAQNHRLLVPDQQHPIICLITATEHLLDDRLEQAVSDLKLARGALAEYTSNPALFLGDSLLKSILDLIEKTPSLDDLSIENSPELIFMLESFARIGGFRLPFNDLDRLQVEPSMELIETSYSEPKSSTENMYEGYSVPPFSVFDALKAWLVQLLIQNCVIYRFNYLPMH